MKYFSKFNSLNSGKSATDAIGANDSNLWIWPVVVTQHLVLNIFITIQKLNKCKQASHLITVRWQLYITASETPPYTYSVHTLKHWELSLTIASKTNQIRFFSIQSAKQSKAIFSHQYIERTEIHQKQHNKLLYKPFILGIVHHLTQIQNTWLSK